MAKYLLSVLSLFFAVTGGRAASLVEGRVYLKNGSTVDCTGDDRMLLPAKSGKLKLWRDAFRETKTKELIAVAEIDSVVCWHPKTPEHLRKFVYADDPGWMWVYFETPHVEVGVYSKKGYGIDTNGGIQVWQRRGWFSRSRMAYWLRKCGEGMFREVGDASRRSKDAFREHLAGCIDDDPVLAERIRSSNTDRNKTILMLRDYDPIVTLNQK